MTFRSAGLGLVRIAVDPKIPVSNIRTTAQSDASVWLAANPHPDFEGAISWFPLFGIGEDLAKQHGVSDRDDAITYALFFYQFVDFGLDPSHSAAGDFPEGSVWDGLYGADKTIDAIKAEANDPDSVKYVKEVNPMIKEQDGTGYWAFRVWFRMRNEYGGMVLNAADIKWAQGKVLEVSVNRWQEWNLTRMWPRLMRR